MHLSVPMALQTTLIAQLIAVNASNVYIILFEIQFIEIIINQSSFLSIPRKRQQSISLYTSILHPILFQFCQKNLFTKILCIICLIMLIYDMLLKSIKLSIFHGVIAGTPSLFDMAVMILFILINMKMICVKLLCVKLCFATFY